MVITRWMMLRKNEWLNRYLDLGLNEQVFTALLYAALLSLGFAVYDIAKDANVYYGHYC